MFYKRALGLNKKKILFQKNKTIKYDEYLFSISHENLTKYFFSQVLRLLQKNYNKKIVIKAYLKSEKNIFSFLKIKVLLSAMSEKVFTKIFLLNTTKYKFFYNSGNFKLLILRVFYDKKNY